MQKMQSQPLLGYGDENSRTEKSGENSMFSSAAKMLLNHLISAILKRLAAVHEERKCISGS